MSRDKELEKTPVKNADKNSATTAENTEAATPRIPWASTAVAEPAVESAEPVAEPAASSVATAEKAAKEEAAEETAEEPLTEPDKPARPGFFDRIPGMRSGALWAHLLFILVASTPSTT